MKLLKFNWFESDWRRLDAQRSRLPHALLIHGAPDIGKREFASHFAQSLLCTGRAPSGHPCGQCQACRWFEAGNHPDFRALLPEYLQSGDAAVEAEEGAEPAGRAGKTKTPSREIKIEQVRALDGFFNVGTHRGGARVILVYPADALNIPSSNALLKTLEEPAPGTVFLLVTSHPDQVLPTIRSRAAQFAVTAPDPASSIEWLTQQGVTQAAERLAEAGGAPLAVLRLGDEESHQAERAELLDALSSARLDPLRTAERCDKAGNENLTLWLMRWVADVLRVSQTGGAPRFHPSHADAIRICASHTSAPALHGYYRKLAAARRVAGHPLNPRLFAEDLLIDYARLMRAAR